MVRNFCWFSFSKKDKPNPEKKRKKKLQVQPGLSVAGPSHISSSGEDSDGNNEQFSLHDSESSVGQIDFDDVDMEKNREDFDNVDITENREYFDQSDIEEHLTLTELRDQINKEINYNHQNGPKPKIDKKIGKVGISIKDFVIAKFTFSVSTKKEVEKYYIGLVKSIQTNDGHKTFFCSFMRKSSKNNKYFVFPNLADEPSADIPEDTIVRVLKATDVSITRGRLPLMD